MSGVRIPAVVLPWRKGLDLAGWWGADRGWVGSCRRLHVYDVISSIPIGPYIVVYVLFLRLCLVWGGRGKGRRGAVIEGGREIILGLGRSD